jgi:hypothetical protein
VDVNRGLFAASDAASLATALDTLAHAFNGVAKIKNGFSLTNDQAAEAFHLRVCMVSVVFDAGITFGELVLTPNLHEHWNTYEKNMPNGEPKHRWNECKRRALDWLRSTEVKDLPVRMVCEVRTNTSILENDSNRPCCSICSGYWLLRALLVV